MPSYAMDRPERDHDAALEAIKRGEILSYKQIRKIIRKNLKGKVVGERLRRTNQGWVYELRVRQEDGHVVFAVINAKTGKILISKRSNKKNKGGA